MTKHNYEVYLTDGRTIVVHADNVISDDGYVTFSINDRPDGGTVIAEFYYENISGWMVIK